MRPLLAETSLFEHMPTNIYIDYIYTYIYYIYAYIYTHIHT